MEGQMCWLLVNSQGDPCKGCNENRSNCNGRHAPYENKAYGLMCFLDKLDEVEKKQREENRRRQEEIIQQRKAGHINGYTRTLLEIRWDKGRDGYKIEVIVKDLINEKAYYTSTYYIDEMVSIVDYCCHTYNVEQIHVETIGVGESMYNALTNKIKNIDIVPLRYVKMPLGS
jgi:hypothetical protein